MARRVSKPVKPAEWEISKIGKVARYVDKVQATDADAAINEAIRKFDIEPGQQGRIAARPIVVR